MLNRSDPVEEMRERLVAQLRKQKGTVKLRQDASLAPTIPWRPYVLDERSGVAWHILTERVESEFWVRRIERAKAIRSDLRVGVAMPQYLLYDQELLQTLNDLQARVAIVSTEDVARDVALSNSVADAIYENRLRLSPAGAARILDRLLERCIAATTNVAKGVSLEVLTAVMLSQVEGFEMADVGVSNRSQQIDVRVHNRNAAGALGRSEIVIAEAKNWDLPVGTTEYFSVYRKIETRFGRSRLGYFVTTDRFTAAVEQERLRDSKGEILVVPLDKVTLPAIWRNATEQDNITRRLEAATIEAASR